jgi:cation diffusion facilitator CzcD-associated flavoprotein CzcO
MRWSFVLCQRYPASTAGAAVADRRQLPPGFPVDTHFNPSYDPWDERMCLVPSGDLFRAIRRAEASIVTDRIARFTRRGILLESGTELEADVIVTATGLNLSAFGKLRLTVDGIPSTSATRCSTRARCSARSRTSCRCSATRASCPGR